MYTGRSRNSVNLFRYFPHDLLALSMLPMAAIGLLFSLLFCLQGRDWIVVFIIAFAVAAAGATSLFYAKLPLYRQGQFFAFGKRNLPQASHRLYSFGCWLSGVGCLVILLLIIVSTQWR